MVSLAAAFAASSSAASFFNRAIRACASSVNAPSVCGGFAWLSLALVSRTVAD
jgi:hypothetical protein